MIAPLLTFQHTQGYQGVKEIEAATTLKLQPFREFASGPWGLGERGKQFELDGTQEHLRAPESESQGHDSFRSWIRFRIHVLYVSCLIEVVAFFFTEVVVADAMTT